MRFQRLRRTFLRAFLAILFFIFICFGIYCADRNGKKQLYVEKILWKDIGLNEKEQLALLLSNSKEFNNNNETSKSLLILIKSLKHLKKSLSVDSSNYTAPFIKDTTKSLNMLIYFAMFVSKSDDKLCKYLWLKGDYGPDFLWFHNRFNDKIRPVWTQERLTLPAKAFGWWKDLQNSDESLKAVIDIAKVFVPPDPFPMKEDRNCTKCAVVGNSGNLKKSSYGSFIDTHDIIIRMNKCPIEDFQKDVGMKTTYYIAYPDSFHEEDFRSDASLVLAPFKAQDIKWLHSYFSINASTNGSEVKITLKGKEIKGIYLYNPELMFHIKQVWGVGKGKWPSTGLLSLFFALQVCDEVDVFGFGANSQGYWDHYFDDENGEKNSQFLQTKVHDSNAELDLLNRLHKLGRIVMFMGHR